MTSDELIGGWPVSELMALAEVIVRRHRGRVIEWDDAISVATGALVDRCLDEVGDELVPKLALFRAAHLALAAANREELRFAGIGYQPDLTVGKRPRFARYWHVDVSDGGQFEEKLVDAIAARQVWSALSEDRRRTLAALVHARTYAEAATSLGLSMSGWRNRISDARWAARALWHSPDPAPKHWGREQWGSGADRHRSGRLTTQRRRITVAGGVSTGGTE